MIHSAQQFGVVVIGDEILNGKRADKHLSHVISDLHSRGMQLAWSRVVCDERRRLVRELKITQLDDIPVLCFGGIGATPDDQTRQAAADAFGRPLIRHADAAVMINQQFKGQVTPERLRMADLPEDCLLIPNAFNRIPGFTLYEHHFFPGFPQLAWPMLEWVLDRYYPTRGIQQVERSARVFSDRESELVQLMEELSGRHPDAKLFSLPHMAAVNWIEIGFRGEQGTVDAAFADLVSALTTSALHFETLNTAMGPRLLKHAAV